MDKNSLKPFSFRLLNKDDIECRVGMVKGNGCSILLYKDARCDMAILDETVGPESWQRDHKELKGNIYCGVGLRFVDAVLKNEWCWKWDAGAESNTEAVKGEASDSFKRACVNWGIGRELYTAPFIWINLKPEEMDNGKINRRVKFFVKSIEYDEHRKIVGLVIVDGTNRVRFELKHITKEEKEAAEKAAQNMFK